MDIKQFEQIVAKLDDDCDSILLDREKEYAGKDRLESFKQIEFLTGVPAPMVCLVAQAKHIIAIFKAVREGRYDNLRKYTVDIINYQRLLTAILEEETPEVILGP